MFELQAIAGHFDLALILLYVFWIFFVGLIIHLQRENEREGYPLESEGPRGGFEPKSLLFYPPPKTFLLPHGGSVTVPSGRGDSRPVPGQATARVPGSPIQPTGANPMLDSIGPGSWAERADKPDLTLHGENKIVPMRSAPSYAVSSHDPNPVGFKVVGCDGAVGGVVTDLWVDRSEGLARYIEVEVMAAGGKRNVLLPITFALVRSNPNRVVVDAITGGQFGQVPGTAKPDSVTLLEEDKICAYYGAGTLYATPSRVESCL